MSLSGVIWPAHPGPQSGEVLSSWIFRLARANAQAPSTFLRLTTGSSEFIKNDLDVYCSEKVLEALAAKTGKPIATISDLTFHSDIEKLNQITPKAKHSKWIIPFGLRKQKDQQRGFQYCPLCLKEASVPYYKKIWRIAFVACCLKHKAMLRDKCPNCLSSIRLRKCKETHLKHGVNEPAICHHCGFDLKRAEAKQAPNGLLKFTQFNVLMLKNGYGTIGTTHIPYSHLYFEGLRILLSTILYRRCGEDLFSFIAEKLSIPFDTRPCAVKGHREVESYGLDSRSIGIMMAGWLLTDWPSRFVQVAKRVDLQANLIQATRDKKPYWFQSVTKEHLLNPRYSPSRLEIQSALSFLKNRNHRITRDMLFSTLGCGVSRFRPGWN